MSRICDEIGAFYMARYPSFLQTGTFGADWHKHGRQPPEVCLLKQLATSNASAGNHLVDVGGNVGDFTALMLEVFKARGPRVSVYELVSDNVLRLRDRFARSGAVAVNHVAVSDEAGVQVPVMGRRDWSALVNCSRFDGRRIKGTSLIGGRRPQGGAALDTMLERVDSTTLDQALAHLGHMIPLIKVDAEGFDGRVLRGARSLLRDGRVGAVYWESNPVQSVVNDSLRSNVRYLAEVGCASYLVGTQALLPLPPSCDGDSPLYSTEFLGARRMGTRRVIPENVISFCGTASHRQAGQLARACFGRTWNENASK